MDPRPLREVTAADIETFESDGAVCLRRMFDRAWLDLLVPGIERAMATSGPYSRRQTLEGEPGLYFSDYGASHRVAELRRFALESPAAELAARLMRSERANFFFDAVWVKEPGTVKRSAWHQDQPYYCVDGRQICILWLPIDPVSQWVSLQCVRGSHSWGRMFAPVRFSDGGGYGRPDVGAYEAMPDIDAEPQAHEILTWALEPGDCIVFHGMTIHGAPGNHCEVTRRRAVSTTWVGDDTTYIERPGEMEPQFEGHGLRPGDPMESALFPRVWPRA